MNCICPSLELFYFGCKCGSLNSPQVKSLKLNCPPGSGIVPRLSKIANSLNAELININLSYCDFHDTLPLFNSAMKGRKTIVYFDQMDEVEKGPMTNLVQDLVDRNTIQGKVIPSSLLVVINYYNCDGVPTTQNIDSTLSQLKL